MGTEVERKFLVQGDAWRQTTGTLYRQGYLSTEKERTVRVRVTGERGTLTIKGLTRGITRQEFEYEIPVGEAQEMLDSLCQRPLIEKRRHEIEHGGLTWEVDEFLGDNQGLVLAEVELEDAEQAFERPDWLGEEVSDDPRYYNANLVQHPYSRWHEEER